MHTTLPPGQRALDHFPRFGATGMARRFPREARRIEIVVDGALREPLALDDAAWSRLPRQQQRSDFHCVTTWSRQGLHWSGVRFRDLHALLAARGLDASATLVVLRAQDGYHAALPLEDLLADDVLLADRLDGAPLPVEHGAPLRLVAPAHYGYKSVKHVKRIEFRRDDGSYRPFGPRFMSHARARVALEERGTGWPGWLLRWVYRPLIRPTVAHFSQAMAEYTGPR
ncbi:molybdopterin-dependent oxidoreductase [Aquincola sp. S2]|uniref:Molybdopterin-dependent oxidoreductase n=1 Tax=Pseudaquabacterium terrae TaxID=2732868 RepID=A0ABX2EC75_9BURK|nr:molybdopterin-dependent oxidoreductase [Aquabacterium terrae]NRF66168.1 molybdopterin-dependent oxidoreductase [Aquabacterium terrae]